jgi:serine/threonine protein kinase
MYCNKCGAKNPDDSQFCVNCGADLRHVTPSKAQPVSDTDINSSDTIFDREAGLAGGTLLGNRYRLEQELGRGGMGVVYKAYDTKLERTVAIKLLPEALARNKTAVELMKKEAKVAIELAHPNIVKVTHFEQDNTGAYLIMEYVEGESLSDVLLERGKLSVDEALGISKQVLEALAYAHEQKVVHRDLKPANIIITKDGKAKVLDFGIARVIKETMTKLTGTTATSGTLLYMAPEQLQGGIHQDGRVDIWAFGIVLYEMLTGGTPFNSDLMILHEPVKPVEGIPDYVNAIIQKCLQKEPSARFQNAQEVMKAIEQTSSYRHSALDAESSFSEGKRLDSSFHGNDTKNDKQPGASQDAVKHPIQQPKRDVNYVAWILVTILVIGSIVGYIMHNNAIQKAEQARQIAIQQENPVVTAPAPITTQAPSGMVYIPAGWFWMGCSPNDNQWRSDEEPYHRVYLDAYYIDKNDVTVDEYTKCVNAGACTAAGTDEGCNYGVSGRGDHPINCVDWNQANSYCQWAGKELPTEAQWEKAARGTDGRKYPWGNDWDASKACFHTGNGTCAVGSYPQGASPYGVLDMAGNVWDWCRDWYDENYYANSPDHNPTGPGSGQYRVHRGGSWNDTYTGVLRVSDRDYNFPSFRYYNYGFRCIRQVSK